MSVIVPSYNQGPFLEETLRSVLLQGYPNLEVRVYDGGSDDGSVEILERYTAFLDHWQSAPDRGQSHAINTGLDEARGEVLAWLNSDDLYEAGALARVGLAFAHHPEALVISGACRLVDKDGGELAVKPPRRLTPEHFLDGGGVPGQPALFFRRRVVERFGLLREDLHYLLDWELWLRISLEVPASATRLVERPLARARIWPGAKTPTAGARGLEERGKVIEELHAGDPVPVPPRLLRLADADLHWRWALHHHKGQWWKAWSHFLGWMVRERRPRRAVKRLLRFLGLRQPAPDPVAEAEGR